MKIIGPNGGLPVPQGGYFFVECQTMRNLWILDSGTPLARRGLFLLVINKRVWIQAVN